MKKLLVVVALTLAGIVGYAQRLVYPKAYVFVQGNLEELPDSVYMDTVATRVLFINEMDTSFKIINVVTVIKSHFYNTYYSDSSTLFYNHIYTEGFKSYFPIDMRDVIKVLWQAPAPAHPRAALMYGL